MMRKGCGVSLYQVRRCLSDRIRVLEHFVVLFDRPEA